MRQRYNPYGGAERIVARALPALERAGAEVTLIARSDKGWGARRVLQVNPFHVGNLWRDWSFARAARAAWRREGFDVVQSHERIPGCDVYRAGDGVHRRWLELRARGGRPARAPGHRAQPLSPLRVRRREAHVRAPAPARRDLQLGDGARRDRARLPRRARRSCTSSTTASTSSTSIRGTARRCATRRARSSAASRATRCSSSSAPASRARDWARRSTPWRRPNDPSFRLAVVGRDREQARFARRAQARGSASGCASSAAATTCGLTTRRPIALSCRAATILFRTRRWRRSPWGCR